MFIYMFPVSHNIKILSIPNLENLLFTSKYLSKFNASWVINLLTRSSGLNGRFYSADICIVALFNPSAVALIFILPGMISGRITARHIPCQVFLTGF